MDKVLDVDVENHLVRVQAGARLKDVNEALAAHGLAFDNFGSISRWRCGSWPPTTFP
jgi:FAD/FMN-containing dehydrogenase